MSAYPTTSIRPAPGRLIIGPTEEFATGTYPYGGVEIGYAADVVLENLGTPFVVEDEGLGEPSEVLEADNQWRLRCELRVWTDAAVQLLMVGGYELGATTRRRTFNVPGNRTPGQRSIDRTSVVVALVPDDAIHTDGLVLYRAVPGLQEGAEISFSRQREHAIPMVFDCLRDDNLRILSQGRLPDLAVV